MASKKKLFGIVVLIALVGGGIYIARNILDWARIEAEKVATESLGVPVSIGNIHVSLKEKSIRISGIRISNPKGYDTPFAVKLGKIEAVADVLSRDKIVIRAVNVSDNDIYLEMVGAQTNLTALSDGIKAKSSKKKPVSSASAKAPTLNIKTLAVSNTNVIIKSALLKNQAALNVPVITMKNVGQDNNQASAVVSQVTRTILNEVLNVAARNGVLQNLSGEAVKGLKKGLGKGTDSLKKSLGGIKFKKD